MSVLSVCVRLVCVEEPRLALAGLRLVSSFGSALSPFGVLAPDLGDERQAEIRASPNEDPRRVSPFQIFQKRQLDAHHHRHARRRYCRGATGKRERTNLPN